jgi:hypothetical protein
MKDPTVGGFSKEANPKRPEETGSLATRGQEEAVIDQGEGCRVGVGDRFHVRDYRDGVLELVHHPNAGNGDARRRGHDRLRNLAVDGHSDENHILALGAYQALLDQHYRR